MLLASRTSDRRPAGDRRGAVEPGGDRPGGDDAYIYALTDEEAYLQNGEEEKPAIEAGLPPDPAKFKCWFCRKSYRQVETLFGAEYPVRDPNTFAAITPILICNECVASFAQSLAKGARGPSGTA
jgi:hypothetical protein